jgi:hypothetical protein
MKPFAYMIKLQVKENALTDGVRLKFPDTFYHSFYIIITIGNLLDPEYAKENFITEYFNNHKFYFEAEKLQTSIIKRKKAPLPCTLPKRSRPLNILFLPS